MSDIRCLFLALHVPRLLFVAGTLPPTLLQRLHLPPPGEPTGLSWILLLDLIVPLRGWDRSEWYGSERIKGWEELCTLVLKWLDPFMVHYSWWWWTTGLPLGMSVTTCCIMLMLLRIDCELNWTVELDFISSLISRDVIFIDILTLSISWSVSLIFWQLREAQMFTVNR